MFHLVDFKGGRQRTVVPDTWLSINDTLCLLPSKVTDQDLEVLARNRVEPGEGWQIFGVSSSEKFESYADAKKKLERPKETPQPEPPRKRKKPGYLSDYSVIDFGDDEPSFTVFRTVDDDEGGSEDEWEPRQSTPQFLPRVDRVLTCKRTFQPQGPKRGVTQFNQSRTLFKRRNVETKCACNSSCHGTILQALQSMQKQLYRTNQMVQRLLMERPKATQPQPQRQPLFRQPYNHVNGQDEMEAFLQEDTNSIQSVMQIPDTSASQRRTETSTSFIAVEDTYNTGEYQPCIASEADVLKNIDVRKWLMSYPKGRALIQKLDSEIFFPKDRQLLVRLVCKKLVELCGNAYPTSLMKEQLAKEIVKTFPFLKSSRGAGHEAFYDTKTSGGFIAYRLKTIRLALPYEAKRNTLQKTPRMPKPTNDLGEIIAVKDELLSPSEQEENVAWLAQQDPNEENKIMIVAKVKETMKNRQKEIRETDMSVAEIFTRYPRLKDYKGEMINIEFGELYSNGEKFLQNFETYFAPRILSYVTLHKPHLLTHVMRSCGANDSLKSLVLLPELLPAPNYKRQKGDQMSRGTRGSVLNGRKIPNPDLIIFVNSDENIMEPASDTDDQSLQPYLICVNPPKDGGGAKKFYIRVDETLIEGPDEPMQAFDILFKLHFVFNIQYARSLENFYNFVSGIVYEIDEPRSSADAFYTVLRNIPIIVGE